MWLLARKEKVLKWGVVQDRESVRADKVVQAGRIDPFGGAKVSLDDSFPSCPKGKD